MVDHPDIYGVMLIVNPDDRFQAAEKENIRQGIVENSALRQDTGYMVEKTYPDIAPYLGAFWAYLMPQ